jgi:hypothetical protein
VKLAWETDDRNGWDAVCEELDLRDRREDGRLKSDNDDLELLVVDEGLSGGLYAIRTVRDWDCGCARRGRRLSR